MALRRPPSLWPTNRFLCGSTSFRLEYSTPARHRREIGVVASHTCPWDLDRCPALVCDRRPNAARQVTGEVCRSTSADFADDAWPEWSTSRRERKSNPHKIGLVGTADGGVVAPMVASRSKDIASSSDGRPGRQRRTSLYRQARTS